MNILDQIDAEHMAEIESKRKLPEFSPGDTVRVDVRVSEGARTRVQAYEGVCIARAGGGLHENFTVRKISYGEGVERTFPVYSPMIEGVEVVKRGKVRRAKLYYLRDRQGKSARIAEATNVRAKRLNEEEMQRVIREKSSELKEKNQVATDSNDENQDVSVAQAEEQSPVENKVVEQSQVDLKNEDQAPAEAKEEKTAEGDSQDQVQNAAEINTEDSVSKDSTEENQSPADSSGENQYGDENSEKK